MIKQTSDKNSYSIVIPCYNESGRIENLMSGLQKFVKEWDTPFELVFVDDGSKDNTSSLIENNPLYQQLQSSGKAQLIKCEKNKGKGNALREGVLVAKNDFILTLDADLACHPLELKKWLNLEKKRFDSNTIYIGSRVMKDSVITDRKERKFVGLVFNFLVQMLSLLRVRDSQCGFKLYPAKVAKDLFSRMKIKGWAHDVELLYRAGLNGIELKEMPVTWKAVQGSKLSIAKDSLKMLLQLVQINFILFFEYFFTDPIANLRGKLKSNDAAYRLPFILISFLLLFGMPILSFHYGNSGDEKIQDTYGKQVFEYIFHDDKTALTSESGIHFYGGLFDFLAVSFSKLFPSLGHYEARHLFNSLWGAIAIIFTGLLATKLLNWKTGLLALLMAALHPRIFGEAMNNPKDIPFAMANICALYFILSFLSQLPKPSYRTIVFLILSISVAIGVRVGGLLLIAYLGLFTIIKIFSDKDLKEYYFKQKKLFSIIKYGIVIGLFSYIGGLLAWPYGMSDPFSNPLNALTVMSNYFVHIKILFKGALIWNNDVPASYVPTWLSITTPILILAGIALFIALYFLRFRKSFSVLNFIALLFSIVFPIFYVIYKKSELHDGVRHFYFVSLSMIVCGSIGWIMLQDFFDKKGLKWITLLFIVGGLFLPFRFMLANHPNEYVYFNELRGGIKGAFGNFETDYYMNSIKQCSEWFHKNELPKITSKKILATNCVQPVEYYFRYDTAKIKLIYLRYRERAQKNWDYGIFYSRFMEPEFLKANYWPDTHSIFVVRADGVALSNVVERTNKSDITAFQLLKDKDYSGAEMNFKKALQYDSNNEDVYDGLSRSFMYQSKIIQADSILNVGLQKFPYSTSLLGSMANMKLSLGKTSEGLQYLDAILKYDPQNLQVYESIIKIYQSVGDQNSAKMYYDRAIKIQESMQADQNNSPTSK